VKGSAFWANLANSTKDRRLIVFAGSGCSIEAKARQSRELALDLLESYCRKASLTSRWGTRIASRYDLYKNLTLCDLPRLAQLPLRHGTLKDMTTELEWLRSQATSPGGSVRAHVEAMLRLPQVAEFVLNDKYVLGPSAKRELVNMLRVWDCPTDPTLFHEVAALLMAEGLVNEVITTNYDCLFEAACGGYGLEVGTAADQDEYGETDSPRIIKLHGSIGGYLGATRGRQERIAESMMLTATEVCRWRHQWAETVLQDHLRQGFVVLFVGFSGRDLNVIGTLNEIAESLGLTRSSSRDRFFLVCHRHFSFVWYQFMVKAVRRFEARRRATVLVGMSANDVAIPLYESIMVGAYQETLTGLVDQVWASVDQTTPAEQVASTGGSPGTERPGRELVDTMIVQGLRNAVAHLGSTTYGDFPRVPMSPWQALFGCGSPGQLRRYIPFREAEAQIRLYTASVTMLGRFLEARRGDGFVASFKAYLPGPEGAFLDVVTRDGISTAQCSFLIVPVQNMPGDSTIVMSRGLEMMNALVAHPVGARRVMFLCTGWVEQERLEQMLTEVTCMSAVVIHPERLARGDDMWLR
jgi:hypothetical protein